MSDGSVSTTKRNRILIVAYAYWPSLGGLELTVDKLAFWLSRNDYEVRVLTFAALGHKAERAGMPFEVIRQPSLIALIRAMLWADGVIARHLSLRCAWPLLFVRKSFVIWHATWYRENGNPLAKWLRSRLMRQAVNVANSEVVGEHLEYCDSVIHPGYAEDTYKSFRDWESRSGFAYLGRLSIEKGCDIALQALARVPNTTLDIIGDGPERTALETQVETLGLRGRVRFLGRLEPDQCAAQLNLVRVLIVPSRYAEPFGAVALEGLAAGCRVIVSDGGGLPEAVGPTGIVFNSRNVAALALAMQSSLESRPTAEECAARDVHLAENTFSVIAPKLMALLPLDGRDALSRN